jgi:hypothetical protein
LTRLGTSKPFEKGFDTHFAYWKPHDRHQNLTAIVGQVWLENNAKLLFQDALRINQGNDSAGSANGLCPLAFEKSYLTLVAPKKPKRFCGAEVFVENSQQQIASNLRRFYQKRPSLCVAQC